MRRELRLRKNSQFAAVYRQGRSRSNRWVVMRALPNGLALSRFGFAVGRRLGKAVVRNLVRRRLREALRLLPVKPGWDVVFIARSEAVEADFWRLRAAAAGLLQRARLLEGGSKGGG